MPFPGRVTSKRIQSANKYFSVYCVPGTLEAMVRPKESAMCPMVTVVPGEADDKQRET